MTRRFAKYGGLLVLGGLVVAALGFPALLRDYLVTPVAISLWAIWRLIISVDQTVYWILLMALCSLLMIRVFSAPAQVVPASTEQDTKLQTRVQHWRRLFGKVGRTREDDAALRASLRTLLIASISQAGRPAGNELHQALVSRHISLPAPIQEYLGVDESGNSRPVQPSSLLERVRRWRRAPTIRKDGAIEDILQWMEAALEITHDQ